VLDISPDGTPIMCGPARLVLTVDGRPAAMARDSIGAVWNTPELVRVRAEMARGESPTACEACHVQERAGITSLRMTLNDVVPTMIGAEWSLAQAMAESARTGHRLASGPKWYQLQLGNTCNLACRSCSPTSSSRVAADRVHRAWSARDYYHGQPLPVRRPAPAWYRDPAKLAELLGDGEIVLALLGGEPFLIEEVWALLRLLVERGWSRRITLTLLTNGTRPRPELERLIAEFKHVYVSVSIDGAGALFEYLRHGARWGDLIDTLAWLRGLPNCSLLATPTLQNVNVLGAARLFRFFDEHHLRVHFNVVTWPRRLRPGNLPPRVRRIAAERLRRYLDDECRLENRPVVRNWVDTIETDEAFDPELFREFMVFTNDLDASRNQRLAEAEPELFTLLRASGIDWTGERRHATAPPLPPPAPHARARASRTIAPDDAIYASFATFAGRPEIYFESGADIVDALDARLLVHGHAALASCRAIADYASHYGRITRALRARLPHAVVYACDIDRGALEFCERELGAVPVVTSWRPEEDALPRDVDVVVCISLLTHTPLDHLRRTLRAWHDMLAPGGVVVFTFLDEGYLDPWLAGEMEQYGTYRPEDRLEAARALRTGGAAFVPLGGASYGGESLYGIAFVRSDLVRGEVAAAGLELLELEARTDLFHQSLVVARRPGQRRPEPIVADPKRDVPVIALYDPRGHEHEAGESTWSRLVAAVPSRPLPTELGFYDPRVAEVRESHAALAAAHGIDAFCYLVAPGAHAPLRELLTSRRPDSPFCLMIGGDETAFEDLVPYLRDDRYLRHENRPLLVVAGLPGDPRSTIAAWRSAAMAHGIGEIHLCAAEPGSGVSLPDALFDSVLESPPTAPTYAEAAAAALARPRPVGSLWRCVLARREPFDPRTVEHYELWLRAAVETSSGPVFIRAWNDWVDGTYLEPDDRDGRSFLAATRRARRGPGSGLALLRRLRDTLGPLDDAAARSLAELEAVVSLHERSRDALTALVEAAFAEAPVGGGDLGHACVSVAASQLAPSPGLVSIDIVGAATGAELLAPRSPVALDRDALEVHGWAHTGDCDPDAVDVFLVVTALTTGRERVFLLGDRFPRPDVAATFAGYPERCGFRGTLPAGALAPGAYRLGIVQRTPTAAYFDPTPVTVTLGRCSSA
jgi:MoaA/NifB/PqqE/SkfB family radical SAM enzyme/SAM-dependent methyltransferase